MLNQIILNAISNVYFITNRFRVRCADGQENDDFDTITAPMLKLSFGSKSYEVKNPTFYVVDLVC